MSRAKSQNCETDTVDECTAARAVSSTLFFSPLTKVKLINELNEREASLGVNENVSWHTVYKDSAWIFIGKINKYHIVVVATVSLRCYVLRILTPPFFLP